MYFNLSLQNYIFYNSTTNIILKKHLQYISFECYASCIICKDIIPLYSLALKSYTMDLSCLSCLSPRQIKYLQVQNCTSTVDLFTNLASFFEYWNGEKRVSTILMSVVFFESRRRKTPPMVLNHASWSMFKNEAHI